MAEVLDKLISFTDRWRWYLLTAICVFLIFSAYNSRFLHYTDDVVININMTLPPPTSEYDHIQNTETKEPYNASDNTSRFNESDVLNTSEKEDPGTKPNLMFIKTHKCGTSTIVNVLYLYGIRRKLNFVMHAYTHKLSMGSDRALLQPRPGGQWNIQCQHGTFYPAVEHRILPKETTLYTTIVRSPLSHFQSGFSFWGQDGFMRKKYGRQLSYEDSINKFLDGVKPPTETTVKVSKTINSAAVDLGWEKFPKAKTLQMKIDNFIEHLSKEMDLVLLTDRMDESLVMLKEKLNWNMTDILYLKRMVSGNASRKTPLSDSTIQRIIQYQIIDRQIFDHFNKTFEKHIDEFGRDKFYEDVEKFKSMRMDFEDKCFNKNMVTKGPYGSITWGLSDYGKYENKACQFLQMRDVTITKIVTQLQLSDDYKKPIPRELISRTLIEQIQQEYVNNMHHDL